MRIGLDFDNTIICYDALFHSLARERRLIDMEVPANKQAVRDAVRQLPSGELEWQSLQADAYGPMICMAIPFPGLQRFLELGAQHGANFCVVSHKGRFAAQDKAHRHDLVAAARRWFKQHGFFGEGQLFQSSNTYFEPTRKDKVARIANLECDVFIDDLEETFFEPGFPSSTRPILIHAESSKIPDIQTYPSWFALTEALFDGAR